MWWNGQLITNFVSKKAKVKKIFYPQFSARDQIFLSRLFQLLKNIKTTSIGFRNANLLIFKHFSRPSDINCLFCIHEHIFTWMPSVQKKITNQHSRWSQPSWVCSSLRQTQLWSQCIQHSKCCRQSQRDQLVVRTCEQVSQSTGEGTRYL